MKNFLKKIQQIYVSFLPSIITLIIPIIVSLLIEKYKDGTSNMPFLILLISIIVSVMTFVFVYIKKNIEDSYEKHYDMIRENLEGSIINIQNKLSKSDEQWKASYHLILSSQLKNNVGNDNAVRQLTFLKNFGLEEQDFIVDEKLVFYLTSFSANYENTYKTCKAVCEQLEFTLLRGDEFDSTGDIFSQIIRYIIKASLIIVNIDGKNPNVFYELGVAHALGKNVMFISRRDNEIPFDVNQYRIVFYNDNIELKKSLYKSIKKYKDYNLNAGIKKKNDLSIEKSLEYYKKALALEPSNEEAIMGLAQVYMGLKMYDEASIYYQKLLNINPNNLLALLYCGKICSETGRYKKAVEIFNQVLDIDPENSQALIEMGKVQMKLSE